MKYLISYASNPYEKLNNDLRKNSRLIIFFIFSNFNNLQRPRLEGRKDFLLGLSFKDKNRSLLRADVTKLEKVPYVGFG
jgi:hypothetical protein